MTVKPWDRQKGESTQQYAWFCDFLDLAPRERTVIKAYRVGHPDAKTASAPFWRAFERWRWLERAEAKDYADRQLVEEEKNRIRQEQIEKFRDSMLGKMKLQDGILSALQRKTGALVVRLEAAEIEPDLKSVTSLLNATDRAIRTYHELGAAILGLDDLLNVVDKSDPVPDPKEPLDGEDSSETGE